ncbi:MerR family transcriptional regulator [Streptomyces lincolnensis]|nr:MerR family transcriptional regulator [Streptomyces lincolnensis]QMV12123.1 MerR family transcriptional regulator [Streptomyces lincolnensis]
MRISDAAAAAGPTPRALRFYEETGPLPDPAHGHRQYGPDEIVARVRVIRERLGLSLTVEALRERGHLPRSGRRSGQHRRRPLTCGADGPWQIFPPVYRNPRSATYTAMRQVAQHFRNTTIPTG